MMRSPVAPGLAEEDSHEVRSKDLSQERGRGGRNGRDAIAARLVWRRRHEQHAAEWELGWKHGCGWPRVDIEHVVEHVEWRRDVVDVECDDDDDG